MNCCVECFKDIEMKNIIKSNNQLGRCDICNNSNVYICNANAISDEFGQLLDIYTPKSRTTLSIGTKYFSMLKDILKRDWDIFNVDEDKIQELIIEICREKYEETPELFEEPVVLQELYDKDFLLESSILSVNTWESFVNDIKYINRFHTNYINLNKMSQMLKICEKYIDSKSEFYRARYSSKSGLQPSEMGPPPKHFATSGRANAEGISCLYLSNDINTTFYEIRAKVHDYVTIGLFRASKKLKVVNLRQLKSISPFLLGDGLLDYSINKKTLQIISSDISRPLRRKDSSLDYLATQYITDFIKSLGYDGIEYDSTINPKGYNLAIFDDEKEDKKFECIDTTVYEVKRLDYDYAPI